MSSIVIRPLQKDFRKKLSRCTQACCYDRPKQQDSVCHRPSKLNKLVADDTSNAVAREPLTRTRCERDFAVITRMLQHKQQLRM